MELLNYMNSHYDWQKSLSAAPYNLKIGQDGDYYILSYNMFLSDMSLHICQEARGAIFRRANNNWICVCRAFDKFFNATEPYAATARMDWSTARVVEKIDGSLIKFFYDRGSWHVATNGTIDASKTTINDHSFMELIERAIDVKQLENRMDPMYTYMFELTSPYNKCVIQYDGYALWYLGRRSMINFKEDAAPLSLCGARHPRLYDFHNLNDCVAAAEKMDITQEGFVVVDQRFNRIKIKGDAYLAAHHLRGNNNFSTKRAIELWQNDSLDDFLAVCPEYYDDAKAIIDKINARVTSMEHTFNVAMELETDKDIALSLADRPTYEKAYVFSRRKGRHENAISFLKSMRAQNLADELSFDI